MSVELVMVSCASPDKMISIEVSPWGAAALSAVTKESFRWQGADPNP